MSFQSKQDKWPIPKFDENDQPHFLFIITPPYSGSTALANLINTSHKTMILQPRGEGQWLIPGMCEKDRWNADKDINYLSVKATWLNKYQAIKKLTQNIEVVIEKSPPNMMRMKQIASQFKSYSFIANNRDPYANCASILYRHHDTDNLGQDERKVILDKLTSAWVMRSVKIKELISSLNAPLVTYEEFCREPLLIIDKLAVPDGVTDSIDPNANLKVKDYKPQPISNQNERQISLLTGSEIDYISQRLKPEGGLLNYFGYELRS
ncbi:sulfotransferase family protein [Microbulbifer sp. CNSA002]|uniref:sulfotransferase family protein n=1 Tax=unclassified Microbulbifer TaxID=2619833 RepID=UPI0039B38734